MVACLEKLEENVEFHQIVDFLSTCSINALIVSPTIYASYIEQFWNTATSKTVNLVKQVHAIVDGKAVVISESSVRSDLLFNDEDGITCLTNDEIFENLALMGYEQLSTKLTFQKGSFSPQWKFLIHTILYCISSKSTALNEFSTNLASAVICLAKGQKFNFSILIFDGMLRNLDPKRFLMYPRFLQLFLNNQLKDLPEPFNDTYETPKHSKKVFSNMARQSTKFLGKVTLIFESMLVQNQAPESEGSATPPEPQPTPSTSQSHDLRADEAVQKEGVAGMDTGGSPRRQDTMGGTPAQTSMEYHFELTDNVPPTPHDSPLSGEEAKTAQDSVINILKFRVKRLEKKRKARTSQPIKRRLYKGMDKVVVQEAPRHPWGYSLSSNTECSERCGLKRLINHLTQKCHTSGSGEGKEAKTAQTAVEQQNEIQVKSLEKIRERQRNLTTNKEEIEKIYLGLASPFGQVALASLPVVQKRRRFSMSSDNASSTVTYTSVSSDSNGPSLWGIPLVNAGEIPKMIPYEEVAQQGQAHPLSPAYVPDLMELDEHVPVHVPEPEHPEYHAPSDDDIQVEDQPYTDDASPTAESPGYIADSDSMEDDTDTDSIDYPDEPGTDDEDPKEDDDKDPEEDPSEEHDPYDEDSEEDPEEDPSEEREPEGDDDDDDTEDEEEGEHLAPADSSVAPVVDHVPSTGDTEALETDESSPTPRSPQTRVPFSQTRLCRARKTVRLEPPMSASMEARIAEHAAAPIPPTNPTYDQAPLGHRAAMIPESSAAAAARAPRRQYDFVDTVEAGQGLIRSPGHDARTIARAADRAEDVGYVRALQASEHRMMTSIEEVNLRVSYQAQVRRKESEDFYTQLLDARTDRRDIRLEIDVVRGQRTAYETELHEVRQAYLSSKARNRALLARLETLETHMSRMEWQRQRAEDDAVRQIMHTQVLEARARIDTVEDAGSSFIIIISVCIDIVIISHVHCILVIIRIMPVTRQGANDTMTPESIQAMNLKARGNDVAAYTQHFQELALMCTKFLTDETAKINKYIGGLPDNIHGNVMSA
ncbi:hypothetical protein Tco_1316122 [Tanacetum coccineum]